MQRIAIENDCVNWRIRSTRLDIEGRCEFTFQSGTYVRMNSVIRFTKIRNIEAVVLFVAASVALPTLAKADELWYGPWYGEAGPEYADDYCYEGAQRGLWGQYRVLSSYDPTGLLASYCVAEPLLSLKPDSES